MISQDLKVKENSENPGKFKDHFPVQMCFTFPVTIHTQLDCYDSKQAPEIVLHRGISTRAGSQHRMCGLQGEGFTGRNNFSRKQGNLIQYQTGADEANDWTKTPACSLQLIILLLATTFITIAFRQ